MSDAAVVELRGLQVQVDGRRLLGPLDLPRYWAKNVRLDARRV